MSTPRKTLLAAATACAFAFPAAAATTFDRVGGLSGAWPAPLVDVDAIREQRDVLTRTLAWMGPSIDGLGSGAANAEGPKAYDLRASDGVRQSIAAQRNPLSTSLRGDSDLFLWNLVAIVHAQQIDRPFDLVQTSITVFSPAPSVVSPVPLPGAIWLLVAGLLGLAAPARRRLAAGSKRTVTASFATA